MSFEHVGEVTRPVRSCRSRPLSPRTAGVALGDVADDLGGKGAAELLIICAGSIKSEHKHAMHTASICQCQVAYVSSSAADQPARTGFTHFLHAQSEPTVSPNTAYSMPTPVARRAVSWGAAARVNLVMLLLSTLCRKVCRMDMADRQPSRVCLLCSRPASKDPKAAFHMVWLQNTAIAQASCTSWMSFILALDSRHDGQSSRTGLQRLDMEVSSCVCIAARRLLLLCHNRSRSLPAPASWQIIFPSASHPALLQLLH